MTTQQKVNENELKVLQKLSEEFHPEEWRAYSFGPLERLTGLDRATVKRACRSLKKKGLAEFEQTLFDEDGVPAGAGYRATEAGAAYLCPCDVCGGLAMFEYHVEKDGTFTMNDDEETTLVRECEQHYKKSQKLQPRLV